MPIGPEAARKAVWRFGFGNLIYTAGIAVAFISSIATLILCALIAIYYVFEQTGTSSRNTDQPSAIEPGG